MKKIAFLTGAGMSAESGITTFRDNGGLWEQYDVMDVASADGFARNPALVHKFYNDRRRQLLEVEPNEGHKIIAGLEADYDVVVITQNVDDLHERAGSSRVLHLHGELMKVRAVDDETKIYTLTPDNLETVPETIMDGHRVRPHIVFFQEAVPNIEIAIDWLQDVDICVVVGTSLNVYPAAGLINYLPSKATVYYVDPRPAPVPSYVKVFAEKATAGLKSIFSKQQGD